MAERVDARRARAWEAHAAEYAIGEGSGVVSCLAALLSAPFRFFVLSVSALLLSAGEAGAQGMSGKEPVFVIEAWQAPWDLDLECREPGPFERLTRERIGTSALREDVLRVRVSIDRIDSKLRLRMATESETGAGERELFATSCSTLLAAAAVVLSLALLPDYFQNERDHAVVTVDPIAPAPETMRAQIGDDEVPGRRNEAAAQAQSVQLGDEPLDVGLHLAALADIGTMPDPAIGLGLVVHAETAGYQLRFRLTRWEEQLVSVEAREVGKGARFDYLSGALQLCKTLWRGSGLCAVGSLGRLSAEPMGIDIPIAQANLLADVGAALFREVRAGTTVRFRAQLDLGVHTLRPRYTIKAQDPDDSFDLVVRELHKTAVIYAVLSVSWGLAF